jgi:outer membrane murein-binding lipoprotein Lpp
MTSPRRAQLGTLAAAVTAGLVVAGCGSTPAQHQRAQLMTQSISLNAAFGTASGTWATVVMGGLAARHENFWQLFVRPPGAARWRLATPPGTADNGGLVLSAGTGQSAVTAFRPSQLLTYTPLIATANGGRSWSALSPLDAPLASLPDALAVQPGTGRMLAVTANGTAEQASAQATDWQQVTTTRTLASTPAGRRCKLTTLTAAAYTTSSVLLGGSCGQTGAIGMFTHAGGRWQATGPALPAALSGQAVSVLRLAASGSQVTAVLQAGSGHGASVLAAWLSSHGKWTLSQPLQLNGAAIVSASLGPAGAVAVATATGTAALIPKTGSRWRALPGLPAGTATLAVTAGGGVQALAVSRNTLAVWQQEPGRLTWTLVQKISVPVQYGSSG